jgi:hypothetical protein
VGYAKNIKIMDKDDVKDDMDTADLRALIELGYKIYGIDVTEMLTSDEKEDTFLRGCLTEKVFEVIKP